MINLGIDVGSVSVKLAGTIGMGRFLVHMLFSYLARNPRTGYQAMFRFGSHQSCTRGWLRPTLMTDSLVSLQEDRSGYTVLIGGKLGRHPQFGKELLEMADENNVIHALQLCAQLMLNHDGKVMRFGDLVNLIGLESIKDMLESR